MAIWTSLRLRWNSGESFPNFETFFCLLDIKVLILGVFQGLSDSCARVDFEGRKLSIAADLYLGDVVTLIHTRCNRVEMIPREAGHPEAKASNGAVSGIAKCRKP